MTDDQAVQLAKILKQMTLEARDHVGSIHNRLTIIEGRLRLLEAERNSGCLPALFAFFACVASVLILVKVYGL